MLNPPLKDYLKIENVDHVDGCSMFYIFFAQQKEHIFR